MALLCRPEVCRPEPSPNHTVKDRQIITKGSIYRVSFIKEKAFLKTYLIKANVSMQNKLYQCGIVEEPGSPAARRHH
ncbi:hypothetical protein CEXT_352981 [Caerostris extrusa]|uniref:Uncharacterized protein n=1 Tax=Caerostris extrusa TaxID=172846 RepID=A0AAV4WCZ5_CAEEX|nr:hypothetical protein CEXT_352981 [Caerostris extrusa]